DWAATARAHPCRRASGAAWLAVPDLPRCLTRRHPLIPLRAGVRPPGHAARLVQALARLGPALARPRPPAPRPVAHPVGRHRLAHRLHQPRTLRGPRASSFGANAVRACLAPLKLIARGATAFSRAATAMAVRSRLYASR